MPTLPLWRFVLRNVLVWVLMTVILVVVPDWLERWMGLQVGRVIGWALACTVWFVAVEHEWRARSGPLVRIAVQFVLWVSAALSAIWISDQFRA